MSGFLPAPLATSQSLLLGPPFFLLLGLLRTLFLNFSFLYSHIFDDSFQSYDLQFHLHPINPQIYSSSPDLCLKLQTYFPLPNGKLCWISNGKLKTNMAHIRHLTFFKACSILFNGNYNLPVAGSSKFLTPLSL